MMNLTPYLSTSDRLVVGFLVVIVVVNTRNAASDKASSFRARSKIASSPRIFVHTSPASNASGHHVSRSNVVIIINLFLLITMLYYLPFLNFSTKFSCTIAPIPIIDGRAFRALLAPLALAHFATLVPSALSVCAPPPTL